LSAGLTGLVVLPLVGAITGSYQIIKGIINTPDAISSKSDGKIWDSNNGIWLYYNLKEDFKKIMEESEDDFLEKLENKNYIQTEIVNNGIVKEDDYYKLLEVPTNATQQQIKKGYHVLAMKYHPDKYNGDNGETFKEIGEAYQILGDLDLRKKYDKEGKEGIKDVRVLDSKQLYTILFGNDDLDEYIGELLITMILSLDDGKPIQLIEYKQRRREILIAPNIINLLVPYINNKTMNFAALDTHYLSRQLETNKTPFGEFIMNLVGRIYIESARLHLGIISSFSTTLEQSRRDIVNKFKMVGCV
jgi:hypothetical protein